MLRIIQDYNKINCKLNVLPISACALTTNIGRNEGTFGMPATVAITFGGDFAERKRFVAVVLRSM